MMLSSTDVPNIKALHDSGKTYEQIAKVYAKQGYLTHRGQAVGDKQISLLMIAHGNRCILPRKRKAIYKKQPTEVTGLSTPDQKSLAELVFSAKMAKDTKLKLLAVLLE